MEKKIAVFLEVCVAGLFFPPHIQPPKTKKNDYTTQSLASRPDLGGWACVIWRLDPRSPVFHQAEPKNGSYIGTFGRKISRKEETPKSGMFVNSLDISVGFQ